MRTVYSIRTPAGVEVARHIRVDRADGSKAIFWEPTGVKPSELPLYGIDTLHTVELGDGVIVTEGEKACEAVWRLGYPAVGTVTGASGVPCDESLAVLVPYDVVLWPDNDDQGKRHMARVCAALARLGGSCRLLEAGGSKGDDAADFPRDDASRVLLGKLVLYAPPYRATVEEVAPRPVRGAAYPESDERKERAKARLLDVVERRLGPPRKADSRSAWWPCPFHTDRTPSFKVDLIAPFFKCYGCDAKGDVFDFMERFDGVGFVDALATLAPPDVALVAVPVYGCSNA